MVLRGRLVTQEHKEPRTEQVLKGQQGRQVYQERWVHKVHKEP